MNPDDFLLRPARRRISGPSQASGTWAPPKVTPKLGQEKHVNVSRPQLAPKRPIIGGRIQTSVIVTHAHVNGVMQRLAEPMIVAVNDDLVVHPK